MQTKEILSTSNSKQTKLQSRPETIMANSHLVRGREVFKGSYVLKMREERVNQKFSLADFVYVIQQPSRGHYNSCIFIAQF